jgi:hypothetical protein
VSILRSFWVRHDLNDAASIAQIEEGQIAVVTPAMNPTGQHDPLSNVFRSQRSAIMRFVHLGSLR